MATQKVIEFDAQGNVIREYEVEVPPEVANRDAIDSALDQAITYFGNQYTNWPTMTAAQKDAANRNAMRALARICRMIRGRFDATD